MALFDKTDSDFHCCAEWHFGQLHGAVYAPLIYSWALRICASKDPKTGKRRKPEEWCFFVSIPKMAAFLNISEMAARSAVHALVLAGFFLKLKSADGSTKAYRPVLHKQWAEAHPDQCAEKLAMPWQAEAVDPLWTALWQASGGKFKPFANVLKGMRKTGLQDDEIVRCFAEEFWPNDTHEAKGMAARFMKVLRARATKVLEALSSKDPLRNS